MKKFLSILFVFLMATTQAHAYTFSLQDSDSLVNDQTANATQITNNINHFVTGLTQITGADNITDGSILTADLADGSVTTSKLASGAAGTTVYQADSTSSTAALNNTTYATLDSMTVTQTFGNADLTVDFSCEVQFSSAEIVTFAIVVDDVVKQERSIGRQAEFALNEPISFKWYQTIASGSHTIKVQAKTSEAGSTYTVARRTLIVEEK